MQKKQKDRSLDTPSEANRDKHINFLALERGDEDPSDSPATGKLAPEKEKEESREKKKRKDKKN